jgi:hypothetical protein
MMNAVCVAAAQQQQQVSLRHVAETLWFVTDGQVTFKSTRCATDAGVINGCFGKKAFVESSLAHINISMPFFVLALCLHLLAALSQASLLPVVPSFPEQYACNVFIVSGGNISSPLPDGLLYKSVMYFDSSSRAAALQTEYGDSTETQVFNWSEQQPRRFVRDDIISVFSASFCSAGPTSAPSAQGSLFLPNTEGFEYISPSNVNGRPCSLFVTSDSECFVLPG